MSVNRNLVAFAAFNGGLAVALGAFAAHGAGPQIKTLLTTGSHYQMVHALLALICAIWPTHDRLIGLAGWLAALGGLIFCLSLSLIALAGLPIMGAVAPVGGLLMIAGWVLVFVVALRSQNVNA